MSNTARTRSITFLALGTIVVPSLIGWGAVTSNAQTTTQSISDRVFKSRKLEVLGNSKLKVVQVTAGQVTALGLPASGVMSTVQQANAFANAAFQSTWERTDKPVAAGAVQRSWYWGPTPNGGAVQEDYAEGAGGKRLVQYFDKSRMEINDPNADPNSKFYVTNGLLSVELISGKVQTGNSTYADRYPADIAMASDADDANAPTYYSFQGVSNTPLGDHPSTTRVGMPAISTISRSGAVADDQTKSSYPKVNYVYFDETTKHNVPEAIWEFLNSAGPVYDSASATTVDGRLSEPWFYATGLPISEPYWARVKIASQQQDVLIQAFERRVVTYVPNGVPGFKVQMGNIGQHYFDWRYKDAGRPQSPLVTPTVATGPTTGPASPTATPILPSPTTVPLDCSGVPAQVNATVDPNCGPIGTLFDITITGFTPNESLSYWFTTPDGLILGTEEPVEIGTHNGTINLPLPSEILEGLGEGVWSITFQGEGSGHQAIAYFKITPDVAAPGTTPTAGPTTDPNVASCTDVPASVNMTITPSNCAKAGTTFFFVGSGFQPGESVGAYLTAPDQAVIGAPFQLEAASDGTAGTVNYSTLRGDDPGVYALTMEGTTSHARAIGYFKVTP
ncbi:MAG: hypothetical protein ABI670_23125 [Chloroflexota bacterium]